MNTVQHLQQTYPDVVQATGANTPHILVAIQEVRVCFYSKNQHDATLIF